MEISENIGGLGSLEPAYSSYESITLDTDVQIEELYTIHYFEYRSDFHFAGERHNFWEF